MKQVGELDKIWRPWRQARLNEMLRFGMPETSAETVSLAEARARQRIAKDVGLKAAKAAQLVVVPVPGVGDQIMLSVDPRLIEGLDQETAEARLKPWGITMQIDSLFK